jgi:hypothetical protein
MTELGAVPFWSAFVDLGKVEITPRFLASRGMTERELELRSLNRAA